MSTKLSMDSTMKLVSSRSDEQKEVLNTNTVCATGDFVQAAPRRRNRMKSVVFMFEDCSKGKLQMADGVRFAPLLSRFISVHAI